MLKDGVVWPCWMGTMPSEWAAGVVIGAVGNEGFWNGSAWIRLCVVDPTLCSVPGFRFGLNLGKRRNCFFQLTSADRREFSILAGITSLPESGSLFVFARMAPAGGPYVAT